MNFQQSYQFLLSLSNLPRREYMKDSSKCDVYLKREQLFLDMLGNPEKKIPHYIHVAGTSGKGSVCAFLHAILMASGKRVGLLASPHPTNITERWKVNHDFMSEAEFCRLAELIKPKLDKYVRVTPYDMISFGEVATSIGLLRFAKKKVGWAVVEAGCGGRYDETNIIPQKDVAVITNIGLDHTKTLGATKAIIAYEKAGIIKKGAMVFTMEKNERIRKIIETETKKAGAKFIKSDIGYLILDIIETNINGTSFRHKGKVFRIKALGEHQVRNAILCIEVARHLGIKEEAIVKGLAATEQPLRMEVVQKRPLVILDGAHNPDKMKTTVEAMKLTLGLAPPNPPLKSGGDKHLLLKMRGNEGLPLLRKGDPSAWGIRAGGGARSRIHLVLGFSNDKNVARMMKQLSALEPVSVACTRNTVNLFRKVANPKALAKLVRELAPESKTEIFLDPWEAFLWVKKRAKKNDLLLVTGSIFMSGELRGRLGKRA